MVARGQYLRPVRVARLLAPSSWTVIKYRSTRAQRGWRLPGNVVSSALIYTSPGTSHSLPRPSLPSYATLPHAHEGRCRCRTACLFDIILGSPSFLGLEPVAGLFSHLTGPVILYSFLVRVKHNIALAR
jgi:hypothetical protein